MGHASSKGNSNSKLIFAQISMKKGEKVTINLKEAGEGKEKPKDIGTTNQVYGQVTKIEQVEKEYEGVVKPVIRLWLRDDKDNELIILSCGVNSIGRNIINSLASIEGDLGIVNIQVYTNKKGYASVNLTHNGKKTDWKYGIAEQDKLITKTEKSVRGEKGEKVTKIERDFFDLDEMFLEEWAEVAKKVKPASAEKPVEEPVLAGGSNDDLPF